jgi:hypothetical protein
LHQSIVFFNIVIIAQQGRLSFEATLFSLSLRQTNPYFAGKLFVATPEVNGLWPQDPSLQSGPLYDLLTQQGVTFIRFENREFGLAYPYGNKIEALEALSVGEPFVFFDSDTLMTGNLAEVPFDFHHPSGSLRREATWPKVIAGGPDCHAIWKSLYDRFGLNFATSLNPKHPMSDWRHYLYFNAGFFYYRCPKIFGQLFSEYAVEIRNNRPNS